MNRKTLVMISYLSGLVVIAHTTSCEYLSSWCVLLNVTS